jgi:alcohol dehydrogenase class IV
MADRYLETFFNTAQIKRFAFPGTLLWGAGSRAQIPIILGDTAPIDIYVDGHFAPHPLFRELLEQLRGRVRSTVTVTEEPRTQAVLDEAAAHATAPGALIALGGGSTLDFGKAVTARRLFGTVDGVGIGEKRGLPPLADARRPRLIAVPTTAGTGADASRYYVTYDPKTKRKVYGKSWELIADWIVLDPVFVRECPDALLASTAFDTFVHLFESLVCRYESSWFGQMLSYDGIPRVMRSLDAIIHGKDRSDERYLELLYCASVAGMAISNVRGGNIHEAAGALLELTDLSHPETLYVFFQSAYEQYAVQTAGLCDQLVRHIGVAAPELQIGGMDAVLEWWTALFDELHISARIRGRLAALGPKAEEVKSHVFERVWSDRVWVEKESPVPLDTEAVRVFVSDSLTRHGLPDVG